MRFNKIKPYSKYNGYDISSEGILTFDSLCSIVYDNAWWLVVVEDITFTSPSPNTVGATIWLRPRWWWRLLGLGDKILHIAKYRLGSTTACHNPRADAEYHYLSGRGFGRP